MVERVINGLADNVALKLIARASMAVIVPLSMFFFNEIYDGIKAVTHSLNDLQRQVAVLDNRAIIIQNLNNERYDALIRNHTTIDHRIRQIERMGYVARPQGDAR